jgi:hypothetical protein
VKHLDKPYAEQLVQLLYDMGSTHTLDDIRALLEDGAMQSWTKGDTWAVTMVTVYPQASVLDIFIGIGVLDDLGELTKEIEAWARERGITFMRVYTRRGFRYLAQRRKWPIGNGWRQGPELYLKRLDTH